jgi:hypothetical protein
MSGTPPGWAGRMIATSARCRPAAAWSPRWAAGGASRAVGSAVIPGCPVQRSGAAGGGQQLVVQPQATLVIPITSAAMTARSGTAAATGSGRRAAPPAALAGPVRPDLRRCILNVIGWQRRYAPFPLRVVITPVGDAFTDWCCPTRVPSVSTPGGSGVDCASGSGVPTRTPPGWAIEVAGFRCDQTGGPAAADTQNRQPAEALERLGRLSLRELSMDSLLQTVADMARR